MKINFSTLLRVNLGFPSEWTGKTVDGDEVKISYRHGITKVLVNQILFTTLSLDQFDLGGFMSDDILHKLLTENKLI